MAHWGGQSGARAGASYGEYSNVIDDNPRGDDGAGGPATPASAVHRPDLWLAAVILAASAVLYALTTGFERVPEVLAQNIQAEWFPRLLIGIIAALALALPFERRVLGGEPPGDPAGAARTSPIRPIALVTAGLLCLVVAAIPLLGSILAISLACLALPLIWGERRPLVLVPFAIVFPSAVALVFGGLLEVYLEPGLLGAWLE